MRTQRKITKNLPVWSSGNDRRQGICSKALNRQYTVRIKPLHFICANNLAFASCSRNTSLTYRKDRYASRAVRAPIIDKTAVPRMYPRIHSNHSAIPRIPLALLRFNVLHSTCHSWHSLVSVGNSTRCCINPDNVQTSAFQHILLLDTVAECTHQAQLSNIDPYPGIPCIVFCERLTMGVG
jgi:hypothetical protein